MYKLQTIYLPGNYLFSYLSIYKMDDQVKTSINSFEVHPKLSHIMDGPVVCGGSLWIVRYSPYPTPPIWASNEDNCTFQTM
jgi:hypothetical protein